MQITKPISPIYVKSKVSSERESTKAQFETETEPVRQKGTRGRYTQQRCDICQKMVSADRESYRFHRKDCVRLMNMISSLYAPKREDYEPTFTHVERRRGIINSVRYDSKKGYGQEASTRFEDARRLIAMDVRKEPWGYLAVRKAAEQLAVEATKSREIFRAETREHKKTRKEMEKIW